MVVSSGFFNSVGGDRKYDAIDMAKLFDGVMEDGVHKGIGTNFEVVPASGLTVNVGMGRAWFNHTWTLNDSVLPLVMPPANAALPRIDVIVLAIDSSLDVRENRLLIKSGTAASTPTSPAMTHTETVNEYPIASILRPANSTTILSSNITQLVGTPATPYAVSRLLDRTFEPSWMHRTVFRGKNLGTSFTTAQKEAISSGSFEDIYIGDYWDIDTVRWRVADINYFLNKGRTPFQTNHLVIVPDSTLAVERINPDVLSNSNAGGYHGCWARSQPFWVNMFNRFTSAFGAPFVALHDTVLSNAISNGMISNGSSYGVTMELMNAYQYFGATQNPTGRGEAYPPKYSTESTMQFALFRLAPHFIVPTKYSDGSREETPQWTRDVISPWCYTVVGQYGDITYTGANNNGVGFRPYIVLKG